MKKKFFSLVIILLLIITLFVLTGCNKQEHSDETQSNIENKSDSLTILSASDKDNIIVARNNKFETIIIDYDGNLKGKLNNEMNIKTMNSFICADNKTIYDLNGKQLFKADGNGIILEISKNGYVLIKENKNNMEKGDYIEYSIYNIKDGKCTYSEEASIKTGTPIEDVQYVGYEDYFTEKINIGHCNYIDATTGSKLNERAYIEKVGTTFDFVNTPYEDNVGTNSSIGANILSMDKEIARYVGNLIDFKGNVLKDISEGEVKYTYYYNDSIFVQTYTDYIYVLDSNLEYKTQPIKLKDTDLPEDIFGSSSGVHYLNQFEKVNGTKIGKIETKDKSFYMTDTGYYSVWNKETKKDNNGNNTYIVKIEIFDDKTMKSIKTFETEVTSLSDIVINEKCLLIKEKNDIVKIYQGDKEYKFENCHFKVFSKNIVNILYYSNTDNIGTIYNLDIMKEIKAK